MTLPASVRVNTQFPFPSLVTGISPIYLQKVAGIWSVGINVGGLITQTPPIARYATDFIMVWDSLAGTYIKVAISSFPGVSRTQRSVTSAITILTTDQVLNCNIPAPTSCALPLASTRGGIGLTFKDVGAQFGNNPLTLTAADNIDGVGTVKLQTNRQSFTVNPFTDGVNSGWFVT